MKDDGLTVTNYWHFYADVAIFNDTTPCMRSGHEDVVDGDVQLH